MTAPEFRPWPKTPRLFRDIVLTEKLDGTNAAVGVTEDGVVYAQSRKRLVTPDDDNFGFARWVAEHADGLREVLGVGVHFGEWWGSGIQRGYGLPAGEKRFSLFDFPRYASGDNPWRLDTIPGLGCVPLLYEGPFCESTVRAWVAELTLSGSRAVPGFMRPEGVIVWHEAARQVFKVLVENDHRPKGVAA